MITNKLIRYLILRRACCGAIGGARVEEENSHGTKKSQQREADLFLGASGRPSQGCSISQGSPCREADHKSAETPCTVNTHMICKETKIGECWCLQQRVCVHVPVCLHVCECVPMCVCMCSWTPWCTEDGEP